MLVILRAFFQLHFFFDTTLYATPSARKESLKGKVKK